MATKAIVKKYDFTVQVKVGSAWKKVAGYSSTKPSLPAAIAAFYKWFNNWRLSDNEYRFHASVNDSEVWMDAYIPELDG